MFHVKHKSCYIKIFYIKPLYQKAKQNIVEIKNHSLERKILR